MIEFVCEEEYLYRPMKWFYDNETKSYSRIDADGEYWGTIQGEQLPDPEFLLAKRRKLYPQAEESIYRPTEVTFALWKDWNARKEITN